jgi:DNA-binding response OmpR family regulator
MSENTFLNKQILLIVDDREISDLLEIHLLEIGFKVIKSRNGLYGFEIVRNSHIDLIIMDWILPGLSGIDICKEVRKMNINIPIFMLTANSDEIDKVIGLEIGADDCLTKPFSMRELVARVKAIFRRIEAINQKEETQKSLDYGELIIDALKRKVLIRGNRVELTPKEYKLLYLLASHPGRTYTRDNLLDLVWDYQYSGYEHTVNSHINRLRSKIEIDPSNPEFILTTWGLGYRFSDRKHEYLLEEY